MLTAAGAVILSLLLLRSVWAVFAVYHVGLCLVLPVVALRRGGRPLAATLGLARRVRPVGRSGPDGAPPTPETPAGLWRHDRLLGLALGLGGGGLLLLANAWLGGQFLSAQQVNSTLAAWGVAPAQASLVAVFMVVVNGPAEEIFWRGFIFQRLGTLSRPWLWLAVPSLCYASYHAVTVFLFMNSVPMAAGVMAGIFLAGCGWAWLRWRTGSLWPALLMHQLLTVAYVIIWLGLE